MDRRTTIKWMFAAAATVPSLRVHGYTAEPLARDVSALRGNAIVLLETV